MAGVLNTDNMSIFGVTIDYGPFGYMERFDPDFICNSSDDQGRYAYKKQVRLVSIVRLSFRCTHLSVHTICSCWVAACLALQPEICKWNCSKLAEALDPFLPSKVSAAILEEVYDNTYKAHYMTIMRFVILPLLCLSWNIPKPMYVAWLGTGPNWACGSHRMTTLGWRQTFWK